MGVGGAYRAGRAGPRSPGHARHLQRHLRAVGRPHHTGHGHRPVVPPHRSAVPTPDRASTSTPSSGRRWPTTASPSAAAEPTHLGIDPEPGVLTAWNRENLDGYWHQWGQAVSTGAVPLMNRLTPRWVTAWGALGAPRLHHTIATGGVISKEAAGEYALATFDERWHPVIREGLAYWRDEAITDERWRDQAHRWQTTGQFVLHVVASAHELPGADVSPPAAEN